MPNDNSSMNFICDLIRGSADMKELASTLALGKPAAVSGVTESAVPAFLSVLTDLAGRDGSPIIVVKDDRGARRAKAALDAVGTACEIYPAKDYNFNNITASREFEHERIRILSALAGGKSFAVITTPPAILQPVVPKDTLLAGELFLEISSEIPMSDAVAILESGGYTRADFIEGVGQYAVRGGILDVYSPSGAYRAEFFGDEIDRLGEIDPATQRLTDEAVTSVVISPAREIVCTKADTDRVIAAVKKQLRAAAGTTAEDMLKSEIAALELGDAPFLDKYIPWILTEHETLLDYTSGGVVLEDTVRLIERADASQNLIAQSITAMIESGEIGQIPKGVPYMLKWSDFWNLLSGRRVVSLDAFGSRQVSAKGGEFGFSTRHITPFGGDAARLREELAVYSARGIKCMVVTSSEKESAELSAMLSDEGYSVTRDPNVFAEASFAKPPVLFCEMDIEAGFELVFARFAVLPFSAKMQKRRATVRRRESKVKQGSRERLMSFTDLSPGDFVVHTVYGIGQFMGIETLEAAGSVRDYVHIKYAGTDKLFLPVDQIELLSKYIGAGSDDGTVKLSKMGGADWNRAKSKAKAAAKDMAAELIDLYARRRRTKGIAFDPDDDMSSEFADAFIYEETDGQLTAVEDISRDMEAEWPMDRLLCGDVGYGKTEVALRAAFKAVRSGYQVAILVPTTILAFQHYQTILSRMRGFPVKVDMVSRFRTKSEQEASLRALRRGETDIIVGTHRLISADVQFYKLGLLIIDEEQRFGVAQKEKIKKAHPGVDVLTLSATPIPRTLNMAMGQLLDMSILEEAPGMRSPVQTYVMEYDRAVIAEALRRELRRGGQAFYLHNRVESVYSVAARLREDLPDARIAVGHGKMEREELEDIWEELVRGEIDILVSTTIIETGVDVPNANTLIIDDADRYGLSQLHQLRGRVGRSARRAYAYFTYKPMKNLSEVAERRLGAIKEYAEFGAGFKIAMRDLEIRGAGNMLGAEQHGHLDAVGYDMYIKLLEEAVLEEQGGVKEERPECAADIDADAYLPKSYITAPHLRMEMYKKIARIECDADYMDITDEMCDRFGEMPPAAENLCRIAVIRAMAASLGISQIRGSGSEVQMTLRTLDPAAWIAAEKEYPRGYLRMIPGKNPVAHLRLQKGERAIDGAEGIVRCLDRVTRELAKKAEP